VYKMESGNYLLSLFFKANTPTAATEHIMLMLPRHGAFYPDTCTTLQSGCILVTWTLYDMHHAPDKYVSGTIMGRFSSCGLPSSGWRILGDKFAEYFSRCLNFMLLITDGTTCLIFWMPGDYSSLQLLNYSTR
jgi:hypothetical protein